MFEKIFCIFTILFAFFALMVIIFGCDIECEKNFFQFKMGNGFEFTIGEKKELK